MASYNIFNTAELQALVGNLDTIKSSVKKELAKAINKAAREVINLTNDEWDATTTAKGYSAPKIKIARGATESDYSAKVISQTRATRANRFEYRPTRKGVYLKVNRASGGNVIRNTFMSIAKSDGKPLMLRRISKYSKGEARDFTGKRFKPVYATSVNQFFFDARDRVAPEALSSAKEQFLKAIL